MQNPGSIRGLFAAAIFVILIAVVMVVYVLFTPDEEPEVAIEEQPPVRLSPEDSTVERVVVRDPEPVTNNQPTTQTPIQIYEDWQEPVQTSQPAPTSNTVIVRQEEQAGSPYSIDDLSHLDLGYHNNGGSNPSYTPPPEPFVPAPPPDLNRFRPSPDIFISSPGSEDYDSLGFIDFEECGRVALPNEVTEDYLESDFAEESEVECMGEAVGNNCSNARFSVSIEGRTMATIYITQFPDGDCGLGFGSIQDEVTLCSFRIAANGGSASGKSESDWIDDFEDDPADEFTQLFVNNPDFFTNPDALDDYNCEPFTYRD